MKRLQAGMLVRLSCGSLCVITSSESSAIYASGIMEDGTYKRSLYMAMFNDEDILAKAPKQDDKMFYRVAYAFGLPVRHREGVEPVVAGNDWNDFVRFGKGYTKSDLSVVYECTLHKELEELERQHRELDRQQDKLAEQMANIRSRMNK